MAGIKKQLKRLVRKGEMAEGVASEIVGRVRPETTLEVCVCVFVVCGLCLLVPGNLCVSVRKDGKGGLRRGCVSKLWARDDAGGEFQGLLEASICVCESYPIQHVCCCVSQP